jgi:hypothetical protein
MADVHHYRPRLGWRRTSHARRAGRRAAESLGGLPRAVPHQACLRASCGGPGLAHSTRPLTVATAHAHAACRPIRLAGWSRTLGADGVDSAGQCIGRGPVVVTVGVPIR